MFIEYLHAVFFFSGVWWRNAGETLLSTSLKARSKYCSYAADRRSHSRLRWLLEWGVWEVRSKSCNYVWNIHVKNLNVVCTVVLVKFQAFPWQSTSWSCTVVCVWQRATQPRREEWWCRRQRRQRRPLPLLPPQSRNLCCTNVWHAGTYVLLLQRPWWVPFTTGPWPVSSHGIHWFNDVYLLLCPNSLRHYCHFLPGVGLCVVQLFRCRVGKTWLRNSQVCIILLKMFMFSSPVISNVDQVDIKHSW